MLVKKLDAPLGAEIHDIDLSIPMKSETIAALKDAIHKHQVVVFRKQKLLPADLVRFTSYLGPIATSALSQYLHKQQHEISVISNILDDDGKNIGLPDAGSYWHTDASYYPKPHMYTLLYALEVPHDSVGRPLGNTQFVSTADAYDALPAETKNRLAHLKAVHNIRKRYKSDRMAQSKREALTEEQENKNPDMIHPVIRTHPFTGRRCIYVNQSYTTGIVGLPENESQDLIDSLLKHYTQPQFYFAHQWAVDDVVVWDNCATQHVSTFDYALPQRRLLYRTTVQGGVPV